MQVDLETQLEHANNQVIDLQRENAALRKFLVGQLASDDELISGDCGPNEFYNSKIDGWLADEFNTRDPIAPTKE